MALLAVPNFSEGRDAGTIAALRAALQTERTRVLDIHVDADHHRNVFTVHGPPGALAEAVAAAAQVAVTRIDLTEHTGVHPRVGALDVAPIVFTQPQDAGAAIAEALVLADRLGQLGLPVYLYGTLAGGRTRASLRQPGALDTITPDFGPNENHLTAGATLVAARPPLVAFNVELAPPATEADAKAIAADIREGGAHGLPGVRALGLTIRGGVAQVSTNIEGPETTAGEVVAAVRAHAPVAAAELVALAPEAAFADFPADVAIPGFDPERQLIERSLR